MALDDEATRHTLLWLAQQLVPLNEVIKFQESPIEAPCATCSHGRSDHSVGGDADNPSPWPCNFPHSRGAPAILCYCADYTPMADGDTE